MTANGVNRTNPSCSLNSLVKDDGLFNFFGRMNDSTAIVIFIISSSAIDDPKQSIGYIGKRNLSSLCGLGNTIAIQMYIGISIIIFRPSVVVVVMDRKRVGVVGRDRTAVVVIMSCLNQQASFWHLRIGTRDRRFIIPIGETKYCVGWLSFPLLLSNEHFPVFFLLLVRRAENCGWARNQASTNFHSRQYCSDMRLGCGKLGCTHKIAFRSGSP